MSTCNVQVGIDRIVDDDDDNDRGRYLPKVPVGPTVPLHGMLEEMPAITHSKQHHLTNK